MKLLDYIKDQIVLILLYFTMILLVQFFLVMYHLPATLKVSLLIIMVLFLLIVISYDYYRKSSCLIFPSKLETWGLPISEYSMYKKPMLIADLPYAHETASGASLVHFFSPDSSVALADAMEKVILGDLSFLHAVPLMEKRHPFTCSWDQLFEYLLERK